MGGYNTFFEMGDARFIKLAGLRSVSLSWYRYRLLIVYRKGNRHGVIALYSFT